jgi:hypothetical protein
MIIVSQILTVLIQINKEIMDAIFNKFLIF